MMNTAGSPTCLMEISAAATSHISWAPLLHSPALQALSWSKVRGRLSVSTPAIPTGMTVSLCAEVRLWIGLWLYFKKWIHCVSQWCRFHLNVWRRTRGAPMKWGNWWPSAGKFWVWNTCFPAIWWFFSAPRVLCKFLYNEGDVSPASLPKLTLMMSILTPAVWEIKLFFIFLIIITTFIIPYPSFCCFWASFS